MAEWKSPVKGSDQAHIRLSGPIESDSIVNGYGLRAVIWTQGCFIHCKGCQNPETWNPEAGVLVDLEDVKKELLAMKGQTGLTFCGGEPSIQAEACIEIARFVKKELGWNVWSFSGYTYETLKEKGGKPCDYLKELDALIEGPFVLEQRDLTLKFRGSKKQRLLHLKNGEITKVE